MNQTLAEKALEIAQSKIGMKEEGGENCGPIVEWSMHPWTDAKPLAWAKWCSAFLCTCFLEAGSRWMRRFGSTSVSRLWERCQQAGIAWLSDGSYPQPLPGDLVFFAGLHHVGLVESIDDTTLYTVEGNHQDQVARAAYPLNDSHLFGFARILS